MQRSIALALLQTHAQELANKENQAILSVCWPIWNMSVSWKT